MVTHPFSVNEMYSDCVFDFDSNTLVAKALTPDCFQRGPSANGKRITGVKRTYTLTGPGAIECALELSVDGKPIQEHLWSAMKKTANTFQ